MTTLWQASTRPRSSLSKRLVAIPLAFSPNATLPPHELPAKIAFIRQMQETRWTAPECEIEFEDEVSLDGCMEVVLTVCSGASTTGTSSCYAGSLWAPHEYPFLAGSHQMFVQSDEGLGEFYSPLGLASMKDELQNYWLESRTAFKQAASPTRDHQSSRRRHLSLEKASADLDRISRPAAEESKPLPFDPDDYSISF